MSRRNATPARNKKWEKKSIRKNKYADKSKLILTLFKNNKNILWNLSLGKIKNVKTITKIRRDKLSSNVARSLHCLKTGKATYLHHILIFGRFILNSSNNLQIVKEYIPTSL